MNTAAELGRNLVSKHQIQPVSMETSRLARDRTVEHVSRDQILRLEREQQGNNHFPCSADHHEQDSCYMRDYVCIYIHIIDPPSGGSMRVA